jgi:poly(beta-D-mannuronate) lyase
MKPNKKSRNKAIAAIAALVIFLPSSAHAMWGKSGDLFDVKARKELLKTPAYASIRTACMAQNIDEAEDQLPPPVAGLKETEGYGTDRSLSDFAWYLMIHSGRAMAGDAKSDEAVRIALLTWANAKALLQTQEVHDAYYALKRGLLPIIVSYTIVKDNLPAADQKLIEDWIDPLVRKIDKKFNGDVDHNNHRYLADSVLALWGSVVGDSGLYNKGRERFEIALEQMSPEGALPLETRRGARALWYIRQAIADLALIAAVYERNGDDSLWKLEKSGKSLPLLTNYFVSAIRGPLIGLADASQNYIPGPSEEFLDQDLEFLQRRGGKRHYMGFAHLYISHYGEQELSAKRLMTLMQETGFKELPLIDDFIGGNATCFWGTP